MKGAPVPDYTTMVLQADVGELARVLEETGVGPHVVLRALEALLGTFPTPPRLTDEQKRAAARCVVALRAAEGDVAAHQREGEPIAGDLARATERKGLCPGCERPKYACLCEGRSRR